jgi:4-hydroxy-tetrahydrodipicolinate synthase
LDIALICQEVGVDGLMCTIPPYVKPTTEGIYQHIKTIHDATSLPIMIYNTQSRTGVNISDENILRLADLPRVMALKDTGTDIERPLRLNPLLKQIKQNFNLLTGDDPIALAYRAHGGVGCVSVAGNIVPKLCKNLQICCERNDFATALTIHQQLFPLYQALFAETNPMPVKYAASYLGLCTEELRLPLVAASTETRKSIVQAMNTLI